MSTTGFSVLRVDSSGRKTGSGTRTLTDEIIGKLEREGNVRSLVTRDTSGGLPFVDEQWITSNFTPEEDRTAEQQQALQLSDMLVEEVKSADLLVIGVPVYNFSIPAALKAWIDLIARARKTFQYTENGPVGLLEGKKAILVAATGGTAIGSDIDFATGYMKHVLGFIGITDVEIIGASQQMVHGDKAMEDARAQIASLDLAA